MVLEWPWTWGLRYIYVHTFVFHINTYFCAKFWIHNLKSIYNLWMFKPRDPQYLNTPLQGRKCHAFSFLSSSILHWLSSADMRAWDIQSTEICGVGEREGPRRQAGLNYQQESRENRSFRSLLVWVEIMPPLWCVEFIIVTNVHTLWPCNFTSRN